MKTHLEYYIHHGISPVRYIGGGLRDHLQRRQALYRGLGLTPLALRGRRVLEVAPGTGQNSLFVASCLPEQLTLLEPNPAGIAFIHELYSEPGLPITQPQLLEQKLEDYNPQDEFDVVICENWLGSSPHERGLLRKLSQMVRPGGVLVMTAIAPIGWLPNLVRRALTARLLDAAAADPPSFEQKTALLVTAFGPHLATMPAMTRSPEDWVQDNMLNPAYLGVCLTIPDLLSDVGAEFNALSTNPRFHQDWRWFKSLRGDQYEFNQHLVHEYFNWYASFLDHTQAPLMLDANVAQQSDAACRRMVSFLAEFEAATEHDTKKALFDEAVRHAQSAAQSLKIGLSAQAGDQLAGSLAALDEGLRLLDKKHLHPTDVAQATDFGALFGRETLYISLERHA